MGPLGNLKLHEYSVKYKCCISSFSCMQLGNAESIQVRFEESNKTPVIEYADVSSHSVTHGRMLFLGQNTFLAMKPTGFCFTVSQLACTI